MNRRESGHLPSFLSFCLVISMALEAITAWRKIMSRKVTGYFTLCMLITAPLSGHGAPTYIELVNKSGIPLHAPKVFVTKKDREGGSSGPAPCVTWNNP